MTFTQSAAQSPKFIPPGLLQVLILDDERFDRHKIARLCSGLDFPTHVTNAVTLRDFEALISEALFDLILIDYRLPDGTGLEALNMVHMSPHNHNAATIMITGQGKTEIANEAISSGCRDYLTKDDLSATNFAQAVANVLRKGTPIGTPDAKSFARHDVEEITERFAVQCAQDMKPMVSRMMRQVRNLRAQQPQEPGMTPASTGSIEDSCVNIWEFLIALERTSGETIIAQTMLGDQDRNPLSKVSQRKPPSPFSKMRN